MPIIIINDKKIEVPAENTVLQAALANGIYIPHFCYHPNLSIAGNCRMCMVEVHGRPKLEISCNLPVADGMIVFTETEAVKKMRRSVLEFMLVNHPLDCPICDQAGECSLQDYHFKYSGVPSRFKEEKVHKPKVVDIGEYVKLDDERCVLCTRCVRFCREIAKTSELCVASRGDHSFITAAPGMKLDNPYSLNTVDLCPVGALTSKDFRFKKRVWFLTSTPSICPGCSNGCQIWIDHENGEMFRWRPRDGESASRSFPTISSFLCNEGRLSYKDWQGEDRLTKVLIRQEDEHAGAKAVDVILTIKNAVRSGSKIVGVASAQSSCEDADAFVEFLHAPRGVIYMTGRQPESPSEDGILRKKDKNPNTGYLSSMGLNYLPQDVSGDILFVVDSLPANELMSVINFKWKMIVQITHDKKMIIPGADIILPLATFAESNGTFVNFSGVSQKFTKAFEPKGEARSVAEWVEMI